MALKWFCDTHSAADVETRPLVQDPSSSELQCRPTRRSKVASDGVRSTLARRARVAHTRQVEDYSGILLRLLGVGYFGWLAKMVFCTFCSQYGEKNEEVVRDALRH